MTTTDTTTTAAAGYLDHDQLTRAQKALMALTGDVARKLAEDHGVCVRPLALRRIDLTSGKVDVVPVPCGARREDVCKPLCGEEPADPDDPVPGGLAPRARADPGSAGPDG